jgi:hypothetical protein
VPTPAPVLEALDADLVELHDGAARWAALTPLDRARLLIDTFAATGLVAQQWAETAAVAKGLDPESSLAGEEWLTGPYGLLDALDAYAQSLIDVAMTGTTLTGARFGRAPGDRVAVRVLPEGLQQAILFHGFRADVWMLPGVTEAEVRATAGLGARERGVDGGVALILGAGNISSIGPLDLLYELVAHNRAGLLKLNPTFASLLAVTREALAPLIEFGVARVIEGDVVVGAHLVAHPGVDKVHITGSAATHDRIVWGDGADAARRKSEHAPLLDKPITSELGGVSPVIVVPGRWSEADLRFQAEHVATMRLHNSGHNCIAAQELVLARDWPQREAFLRELGAAMARAPRRPVWYPGAAERLEQNAVERPDAEWHGGGLLTEVKPDGLDPLERTEVFAPVLAWTELPGEGEDFLLAATAHANEHLTGTLGANVIVSPADRRAMGPAFGSAIAELRYGTIGINAWTGVGFLLSRGVWGAFPGQTLEDVGSGIGVVHNAHLLAGTERMVVSGPFRPFPRSVLGGEASLFPTPPWFVTRSTALETARRFTAYAAAPGWGRLLATLVAAFRPAR